MKAENWDYSFRIVFCSSLTPRFPSLVHLNNQYEERKPEIVHKIVEQKARQRKLRRTPRNFAMNNRNESQTQYVNLSNP